MLSVSHAVSASARGTVGACVLALLVPAPVLALGPASDEPPGHGIHSMAVPCGVAEALAAIESPGTPERARFVIEVTRRFYNTPLDSDRSEHPALAKLASWLTACTQARAELDGGAPPAALDAGQRVPGTTPDQAVPLPMSPAVWTERVFDGKVTADALATAILTTRSAALLYTALLSLDEPTRAWLVGEADLLERLHRDHVAPFMIAAPALRVTAGQIVLPGGARARPAWQALAGRSPDDPTAFLLALLAKDRGVLAWFLTALQALPDHHLETLLRLHEGDTRTQVAAASELYAAFRLAAFAWDPRARPFWRPAVDPALLLVEMQPTPQTPAGVPGTRAFWSAVFRRDHVDVSARDRQRAASGLPPTAGWLLTRVFVRDPAERRVRANQVLYAARQHEALDMADVADAITAVRGVRRMPALVLSLERAGIQDIALVARLARRADTVGAVRDSTRAAVAHAQWQGSLALLLAAAAEGSLSPALLHEQLDELAALAPERNGRFEGRVVEWEGGRRRGGGEESRRGGGEEGRRAGEEDWRRGGEEEGRRIGGPDERGEVGLADVVARRGLEREWLARLSGPADGSMTSPVVTWEGTSYQLDVPGALARQIDQARGLEPVPFIDLARALRMTARRLEADEVVIDDERTALRLLEPLALDNDQAGLLGLEVRAQWRTALDALSRTKHARDAHTIAAATALTRTADALLARGLLELTYARALADHEDLPLTSFDAASRHDLGTAADGATRRRQPWTLPAASTAGRSWHVKGSLLALDVALAPSALRRITAQVLTGRPTVNDMDRRTFVETVVVTRRRALTDASRDGIAAALARGRTRARAAQEDAGLRAAFAARAGMSPDRLALWAWMLEHEPQRAAHWVAPHEWLYAGLDGEVLPDDWHAWGTAQWAATGCLCTQLAPPVPPERYAGHVGSSVVAVAVPDLQLRVAEALAQFGMPAALARDVLSAAVYDLVNRAPAQDHDDWRALVDHILGVDADRVEDYLALFTVDGPLRASDGRDGAGTDGSGRGASDDDEEDDDAGRDASREGALDADARGNGSLRRPPTDVRPATGRDASLRRPATGTRPARRASPTITSPTITSPTIASPTMAPPTIAAIASPTMAGPTAGVQP